MDLSRVLHAFANASSEFEVCEIIATYIVEINFATSVAVYLYDSHERSHCIIELMPLSGKDAKIIPISSFGTQLGYIKCIPETPEYLRDLHNLAQLGGFALNALKQTLEADIQSKRLGKTSLILDTILEMLSDIILQKDRFAIARIAGQFLMGQLRIGTYALIGRGAFHTHEILSYNGFKEEQIVSLLSSIQDEKIRSSLNVTVIPMEHGHVERGYILLDSGERNHTEDDTAFISMIGMITALSLERTALFEEESRLMALHKDLALAAEIQSQLMPDFTEQIIGCEVSGTTIPSDNIGGDYVDILQYSDGSMLLIMGDVSGKGISAAMIMTMVKSACTLHVKQAMHPKEIVHSINALVHEQTNSDTFITFACIHINADRTFMRCINAGHEFPLLKKRNGTIVELDKGCMVLGVVENIASMTYSDFSLEQGDLICLYTDGVCDSSLEQGNEPIKKEITGCNKLSVHTAEDIIKSIINEKAGYQGARMNDDATLLLLRISS